jgi:hypothetical protein
MSDGSVTDEQAHTWLQDIADKGYVSLHYDSPALGGEDRAEIAGGGYQRFKMSFSQPNNRAIWSLVDARFTGLLQTKLVYFGIWDSLNKGMLRSYGELPEPAVVLTGKGYVLHAGLIAVSFG